MNHQQKCELHQQRISDQLRADYPRTKSITELQQELYYRAKRAQYADMYGASWGSHCAWIYALEFLEASKQLGAGLSISTKAL